MRIFGIKEKNPLNYLVCGQLVTKDGFLHMKRTISENVLILVTEGTLFINSNNREYEIQKNQFILLKADEEHFGFKESNGPLLYYWVHFKNELEVLNEKESLENYSYIIPEKGTYDENSRLLLLFRQLMDFSLEENLYNKSLLDYSLSTFMIEFSKSFLQKSKTISENPTIQNVCSWIKSNYSTDFSIEELSKEFGYQSSQLSILFRKSMNMSIIQYTTQVRITAAKNLLSNFSVKETAYSCGFEDEKYFMKIFKKLEGITPTQYKQAFSRKNINK